MARNHHLDLDNLESPLVSPSPLTSVGGIPGSAIAEKIFNDPDSWDNPLGEFGPSDLEMQWLAGEVEKLKRLSLSSDEREVVLSMEQSNLILRAFPDHYKVTRLQDDSQITSRASVYGGIQQDITGPLQLSPQPTGTKGDKPDGFTKIWQSKGLRPPPSPLSFSPPSSTESSEEFGIHVQQPSPLQTPNSKVASASTTWSFLEWYGIHPGSPGKDVKSTAVEAKKPKPRPRGILQGSTALSHALSQPPTSPPKVPLPPIPPQAGTKQAETPAADRPSSAVRRLPAVPPSAEPMKTIPFPEILTPVLPRRSSPALSANTRRPSEPVAGARLLKERRPSEPVLPTRLQSIPIRSPPPAGPRPKGFVPRGRDSSQGSRTPSRSPLRSVATRVGDGI
ncbi:hypothetical protein APHAL10511_003104 [Amanita phalloides]|nr:hypothetical protein APHAL10511_003104 [Amanita phalloides]